MTQRKAGGSKNGGMESLRARGGGDLKQVNNTCFTSYKYIKLENSKRLKE